MNATVKASNKVYFFALKVYSVFSLKNPKSFKYMTNGATMLLWEFPHVCVFCVWPYFYFFVVLINS